MNAIITEPNDDKRGWHGELSLRFSQEGERTLLSSRKHIGPLVVQRPFYPEGDVCHVYIVHPPGGIVGGDQLQLDVTLECKTHALITTPAATKFYRSAMREAVLDQRLHLQNATLEWLPQETIVFRDADATSATRVHLDRQSQFIGWEITCYGRPASGDLFMSGRIRQHLELSLDNKPIYIDRLHIDGESASRRATWGLAENNMLGTLLAYPARADDLDAARKHNKIASTIVDGVLVCRCVDNDNDAMKRTFVDLWRTLRPRIVGREAVLPRIWAT